MKTTYYPRPEILARPELEKGHAVIEASAGTGKTFTLEHLVLDLIIKTEAKIEEILVVTFTDAATRELRERVRALIRKVCDEGSADKPPGDSAAYWEVNEATRGRLREALFRFDGAAISTIHSYCQRVLSEQAFLGGRLFEQEHADGSEMFGFAFREEVRLTLVETGSVGDALRLWIEQNNTLQDLQDFLYKCHREGCPERCPITPLWDPRGFRKALDELPESENLMAAVQTFFTDGTSRRGYEKLHERLFAATSAIAAAASFQVAVSLFTEWTDKKCTINKAGHMQIDHLNRAAKMEGAPAVFRELATGLNEIMLRAAPEGSFFAYELLPRVQIRLAARKRSLGLIDYDDMLLGVLDALKGTGSAVLLDALRRRWKYALVDEFQDTDPVQWEIFRQIFVDGTSDHRLFVIGDPKQAIYGFRGADVHTYKIAKDYLIGNCGAARLPLIKNYRSTAGLIEAVNKILTAKDPEGKTFFDGLNSYDDPVECGDCSRTAEEAEKPAAPVHLIHLYDQAEKLSASSVRRGVACFIAEEIKRLVNEDDGLVTGSARSGPALIKHSDIFILTRSGREGQQIGEVLRRYGIPHAFYKQDGLFKTDEADNVHRLLCAITSPADPAARMSAWLTPFFDIPLEELMAWKDAGESHPLVTLLLRWKLFADGQNWARLFDEILTGSGLVRRLVLAGGERALTNYLHLFEVLLAEAHSHPVTLRELARGLKARIDGREMPEGREGDIQRLETDREAVQILTMHKAKGLEAEVVFIGGGFGNPGGGSGIKTSIYHLDNQRQMHIGRASGEIAIAIDRENNEENQRLAYVAITRAKSRLYLPYFGEAPEGAPEENNYGYNLGKFYRSLQKQLDLLREDGRLNDSSRFVYRSASCRQRQPREHDEEINLEGWPGESLLELPASSAGEAGEIEPGHRGVLLTSYTRMKQGKGWQPPIADADDQATWRSEEVSGEVAPAKITVGDDEPSASFTGGTPELPGGREAGIFLHALLEDTPASEIGALSFSEWSSLPAVYKRTAAAARRHGFAEEYLPGVFKLIYFALRTPIRVKSTEKTALLQMTGGVAEGNRRIAEMAFIYPIPEAFHPLISGNAAAAEGKSGDLPPFQALRGYMQGLIDFVFEHEEKIYLLDWKSDCLKTFDEDSLNTYVEANYSLQARVYTLAVLRLLGIRSEEEYAEHFGGVLYLFLRGIRPGNDGQAGEGIWFSRPPWCVISTWEEEFVTRAEWGGKVIESRIR